MVRPMEKENRKTSKTSPFWRRVDELLRRSARKMKVGVNLSRLSALSAPNQSVVVASKVLGSGRLEHPLTITAPAFSQSAKAGITKAGGKVVALDKLRELNPAGKDLIILI